VLEPTIVTASALAVFLLGCWLTAPLSPLWRWLGRGLLAGVLVALLMPAGAVDRLQDWIRDWLPLAASASQAAGADWVVHFLCFTALAALLFHFRRDVPAAWIAAGLVVLGGLTEALQTLVDGRSATLGDWVADCLGICLGYAAVMYPVWRNRAVNQQ
jgi:hypothetical protein